ncbi:MAG: hypothetical protein IPJ40_03335 [Saprospirales bacterium]|nr:hypothetical protein [Saprospirales bacterium]
MNLEEKVRNLIADNQFDVAFKQLFHFFSELKKENESRYAAVQSYHDELTILSSHFFHSEKKDRLGIGQAEAGQIDRNRVAAGLLAVLDACKSEFELVYSPALVVGGRHFHRGMEEEKWVPFFFATSNRMAGIFPSADRNAISRKISTSTKSPGT